MVINKGRAGETDGSSAALIIISKYSGRLVLTFQRIYYVCVM